MKVITFSRSYPDYHSEKGKPTFFVEKILNNIGINYLPDTYLQRLCEWNTKSIAEGKLSFEDLKRFYLSLQEVAEDKGHTIRAGGRFKVGEKFSPRVWSEKPYNSPQIIFAPGLEIENIFRFEIQRERNSDMPGDCSNFLYVNNNLLMLSDEDKLAGNDGLEHEDLIKWFKAEDEKECTFSGNIICWDSTIKY